MRHRLLLVEQSNRMREVLHQHLESVGFDVDSQNDYAKALSALNEQYRHPESDYSAVVFGWPPVASAQAQAFARSLEQESYQDLPVVVMSADLSGGNRAWAAERMNTVILDWKQYADIEEPLNDLLDDLADAFVQPENERSNNPLDHADIHLLVVDDSLTIRYALRDLFELRGYRVTLAADPEEALAHASTADCDIAVIDYYLADTTGDILCRTLKTSPQTAGMICTVLTGTYSDHIIRRSLRAGAVECMFKNESSELLLNRIDALARIVRQKRELHNQQYLLEELLESLAGAVILLDPSGRVLYVSASAIDELQLDDPQVLTGEAGQRFLAGETLKAPGEHTYPAVWSLPDGRSISVDYQHTLTHPSGNSLLRFSRRAAVTADTDVQTHTRHSAAETPPDVQSVADKRPSAVVPHRSITAEPDIRVQARALIHGLSFEADAEQFLNCLLTYLQHFNTHASMQASDRALYQSVATAGNGVQRADCSDAIGEVDTIEQVGLMVMDIFVHDAEEGRIVLSAFPQLQQGVNLALAKVISQEGHTACLTDNRYGFLLRYDNDARAFAMTQKIMQICMKLRLAGEQSTNRRLVCNASLLSLDKNKAKPVRVLLQHALKGVDIINRSNVDGQALLIDLNRVLSA